MRLTRLLPLLLLTLSACATGGGGGTTPPPDPDPEVPVDLNIATDLVNLYDRLVRIDFTAKPLVTAEYTAPTANFVLTLQYSVDGGTTWDDAREQRTSGSAEQRILPRELPIGLTTAFSIYWDADHDLRAHGSEGGSLQVSLRISGDQVSGPGTPVSPRLGFTVDWSAESGCVVTAPSIVPETELLFDAGTPVNRELLAAGGERPLTWSANRALVAGLSLDPAGVIRGTPTVSDELYFITVSDDCDLLSRHDSVFLRIRVKPADCDPLRLDPDATLPEGKVGESYSLLLDTLLTDDGKGALQWSLTGSISLPDGLRITAAGVLTGTPEPGTAGVHAVSLQVEDSCSSEQSDAQLFTLLISN